MLYGAILALFWRFTVLTGVTSVSMAQASIELSKADSNDSKLEPACFEGPVAEPRTESRDETQNAIER